MSKVLRDFLRQVEALGVQRIETGEGGKHRWVLLRSPGGRELKVQFSRGAKSGSCPRAMSNRLAQIKRWAREEVD